MPGVEHLHDLADDLLAGQPAAEGKARPDQLRQYVLSTVAAGNAFVDDADRCVHAARRARPHHGERRDRIAAVHPGIGLAKGFGERHQRSTLAMTFELGTQYGAQRNSARSGSADRSSDPTAHGPPESPSKIQHGSGALRYNGEIMRDEVGPETGREYPPARLPRRSFQRGQAVAPMAAIGILDELRLAQARLMPENSSCTCAAPPTKI